jgi:hypothetical protein
MYPLDIEIWPTCIVIPPGYRLALTVLGRDFDHGMEGTPSHIGVEMRGAGFWYHDDPRERPADIYDGVVTVYSSQTHPSYVLLPMVPPKES